MPLNKVYRQSPEFVASFDWVDLVSKQGHITLYSQINRPTSEVNHTSYETGADTNYNLTGADSRLAQTFTVTDTIWLSSVELFGSDALTASYFIDIRETSAGEPTDRILGRSSLNFPQTIYAWRSAHFTPIKLEAGVYAIVINSTGIASTRLIKVDQSSATYAGGNLLTSADAGVNWTTQATHDVLFVVNGFTKNPHIFSTQDTTSEYSTVTYNFFELITTDTLVGETDTDIEIRIPMIIEGKAKISIPWTLSLIDTGSAITNDLTLGGYLTCSLIKDDGSETELDSIKTKLVQINHSTSGFRSVVTTNQIVFNLARTHFGIGDILRLKIKAYINEFAENGSTQPDGGSSIAISKSSITQEIPVVIN